VADVYLDRITVYPIKSLNGIDVPEVHVLASGAIENDRRFALVDADGHFVNGKRTAAVHKIRAEYNLGQMTVRLNDKHEFSLLGDQAELGEWMSDALGTACVVVENRDGGFPDDTNAAGPTVIGTGTLTEVASWFPGLTLDEVRGRFRANLEIGPAPPFWEDQLVGPVGKGVRFTVGDVAWFGVNPCQRCVVPTRDSVSGEVTRGFQRSFATERERTLPAWAPRERFNHFFRLAVNTRLAPDARPGRISVGIPIVVSSSEPLP
jgi:uncharacterized protein